MTRKDAEEAIKEIIELTHGGCNIVAEGVHRSCTDQATAALLDLLDRYCEGARIDELEKLTTSEIDVSDVERFEYQNDGLPMLVIEPQQIDIRLAALKPKSEEAS